MSVCQTSIFNRKKHQIKSTTLKSFSTKKEIRALIKDVQKREERERWNLFPLLSFIVLIISILNFLYLFNLIVENLFWTRSLFSFRILQLKLTFLIFSLAAVQYFILLI